MGKPSRCNQNNGEALIMAINAASRKGTTMATAARIPAMTTTKAAMVNNIWDADALWGISFMGFELNVFEKN